MVAVLAHCLAVLENRYYGGQVDVGQVALAALYHDATEIITGDMPTPIKYYNSQLRDAYQDVEHMAERKLLSMLPEDLRGDFEDLLISPDEDIHRIVKAADKLAAYLKCVEEVKAGNAEFRKAKEQTWETLQGQRFPALDYFFEHFLPSFELTLDELE